MANCLRLPLQQRQHFIPEDVACEGLVVVRGIVDAVEANDYQVFDRRARVGTARRLRVAGAAWWDAMRARRASGRD